MFDINWERKSFQLLILFGPRRGDEEKDGKSFSGGDDS
jgi:hypothetical protein